jgi:malate dehydrogenase (oxaloacetate-decarboxylating)(NADP+)
MVALRNRVLFFADTGVNVDPDAKTLANIALLTAQLAKNFEVTPRVAFLSYSNFGTVQHPNQQKIRDAVRLVRELEPSLPVDGEMMAHVALSDDLLNQTNPSNHLKKSANVLIFPDLESGNIGQKLVLSLSGAEMVGPLLVGTKKPAHVLLNTDEVRDIVRLTTIALAQAKDS